jgi:PilZ domain
VRTRKSARLPVTATGTCRSAHGMLWDAPLADLSEGGCRIADARGRLRTGETVRLFIAGTGPHMARVAWQDAGEAGLVFQRNLSARVVRHFAEAEWDSGRTAYEDDLTRPPVRRLM